MKKRFLTLCSTLLLGATTLTLSAQETFNKIAFMGDGVEINGTQLGWTAENPAVVEADSQTGEFEFTMKFTGTRSLWQMYVNGIGESDWDVIKQSIYTPNFYAVFSDLEPQPEDISVNVDGVDCFNKVYFLDAIGKAAPVYADPDGGFWVGGSQPPYTYTVKLNKELTEMTIVSVNKGDEITDFPETLYLYGDATPGGWTESAATKMQNLGNGVYRWEGQLIGATDATPGALQIYTKDPAVYGTGNNAVGQSTIQAISCWGVSNTSIELYEERPADCYYTVQQGQTNDYILTVDLVNKTFTVQLNNMYLAGTGNGWQFEQLENQGNRVFTYKTGLWDANSVFSFYPVAGWGVTIATDQNANFGLVPFSDTTLRMGSTAAMANTYKGYFIVSADLNNGIFSTKTYNPDPVTALYVAENGVYHKMTVQSDGSYLWTGELSDNFTLTTGQTPYPCYQPLEASVSVPSAERAADNEMLFNVTADNQISNSWNAVNKDTYTIRVNPAAMTMSVTSTSGITVVEGVISENHPMTEYFDLQGRKVENPSRGLYIRVDNGNAQKVIIK